MSNENSQHTVILEKMVNGARVLEEHIVSDFKSAIEKLKSMAHVSFKIFDMNKALVGKDGVTELNAPMPEAKVEAAKPAPVVEAKVEAAKPAPVVEDPAPVVDPAIEEMPVVAVPSMTQAPAEGDGPSIL